MVTVSITKQKTFSMNAQYLELILQTATLAALLFGIAGISLHKMRAGKLPNAMLVCSIIFGTLSFLTGIIWPCPEIERVAYCEFLTKAGLGIAIVNFFIWLFRISKK